MKVLELITPALSHREQANEFKKEFFAHKETVINESALLDQMDYEKWLIHMKNNTSSLTVSRDWVTASTFFAVRKEDKKIVGIIDIRHHINHSFLSAYGGHIGYAIRPSERRKGYATQMLKLALSYGKSIGLSKVMLGCYADNEASYKTIEKCGGIRTEEKPYADGKPMYIYWIAL